MWLFWENLKRRILGIQPYNPGWYKSEEKHHCAICKGKLSGGYYTDVLDGEILYYCKRHFENWRTGGREMPLSEEGKKVLANLVKEYGAKKGKSVFYSMINAKKPGSSSWHGK